MDYELNTLKVEEIEFGERFREDYGNLEELIASFKEDGIISPLAVYRRPEPTDGQKPYLLLAGGRRFQAASKAEMKEVPCKIYVGTLTELQIRSIELSENIYRKDLEWHEKVSLCKEIHELQQEIHGRKISTSPDAPGWSQADTAAMMGRNKSGISQDLTLAAAMEVLPELKFCKTQDEATKIMKKMQKEVNNAELVAKLQKEQENKPVKKLREELINSFIINDFLLGIQGVPDRSVDIVEIDPPYAIDITDLKSQDSSGLHNYNEIAKEGYLKFMADVLKETYRVMSENSWLILWFAQEPWFEFLFQMATKVGFSLNRIPGIWLKPNGQTKQPEIYLGNCYETFFYARKGRPEIIKQGRSNAFVFNPIPPQKKVHPTERPIEMMQEILGTFAMPGKRLLVPFLGSGNTLLAASNLNLTAFGYELSQPYKDDFSLKVLTGKPGEFKSYD